MTYKTIGIDIGSISVSAVLLNTEREILQYSYAAHKGKIKECMLDILEEYDSGETYRYAITSSAPPVFNGVNRYDSRICIIAAARHLHPDAGSLLLVGGEKFNLILFDNNGDYLNCR
jgi:activator of 2-hydroxyglutaryl-CoA dehydratase